MCHVPSNLTFNVNCMGLMLSGFPDSTTSPPTLDGGSCLLLFIETQRQGYLRCSIFSYTLLTCSCAKEVFGPVRDGMTIDARDVSLPYTYFCVVDDQ